MMSGKENKFGTVMGRQEFCDHFEDGDFFEKHPDPILIAGDDGQKCVCISWANVQEHLRLLDKMRRMARPHYNPEKEVTLKVTLDEEIYNQLEIICAQSGYTVAGATEEFFYWSVKHPDEVRVWIEKCRQDGAVDECLKNPIAELEWI